MAKLDNKILIQEITQLTDAHFKLFLEADPSEKVIGSYLDRSYKFELVTGKKVLGVILMVDTRPETVEIVNVAVAKTARNHGYGEKLVKFAIEWAKINNYHTIEIGTGSTSFAQLYLYQKCGFRIVSVDKDFFIDNYDEPIVENNLVLKDMLRLKMKL